MPVPTDTFRKTRWLNGIFALSALALLGSVGWMVFDDYNREFRHWQRHSRVWQASVTADKLQRATSDEASDRLNRIRRQIKALENAQAEGELQKKIADLDTRIVQAVNDRDLRSLPAATFKGHIVPLKQQIEMARLETPPDSDKIATLEAKLEVVNQEFKTLNNELLDFEQQIEASTGERQQLQAELQRRNNEFNSLVRESNALEERLGQLDPKTVWTKMGKTVRDAPLLDWLNPSEKPLQVVVPDVLTDLNTYVVETIDRCQSCHVNINDPAFGEANLLLYAERALAHYEGQDTTSDPARQPVVLAAFWVDAADAAGLAVARRLDEAVTATLEQISSLRTEGGLSALEAAADADGRRRLLLDTLPQITKMDATTERATWHRAVRYFVDDVKAMLLDHLGQEQFGLLLDLYRHRLLEPLNVYRDEDQLPALDATSVMLAHPQLQRYVDPESSHPMKTMGCTVCHEGSGQETIFEHTVHTPRPIWVDRHTGAPVPDFLVDRDDHGPSDGHGDTGEDGGHEGDAHAASINIDSPFSPRTETHTADTTYRSPGNDHGDAVQQKSFWKNSYGWTHVHYMHWEKPMHELDHVESSCNKCHSEIYDLRDAAPRLFEGRQLFAQSGCVNCHAVTDLEDDLDIRQIGPSLKHLKHKLSSDMAASWIWSPKSLRPTTRMPHYFMLENNASPVEILRTRVEVTAMTRYLMQASPGPTATEDAHHYDPVAPPALPGDAANGRLLFHQVGCQACHTNLNETGREWITEDLVSRQGLNDEEAASHYEGLNENDRHWYVLRNLPDRIQRTGPELSAVGTKLLAGGRSPEEARGWLYNWLLNPRSYHSYTIMPQLRLTETEALDIAAYLLAQTRDDYEAADFSLDDHGRTMLKALVVNILSGQSSHEMAGEAVASDSQRWSEENQLMYLGEKMISHYGCSGCHQINGFEEAVSACTKLDDWGSKDPHMLDFGHFEHAFDAVREHPRDVDVVAKAGLTSDATKIGPDSDRLKTRSVTWEAIENERRPWLYHKLHNTRVYDRGRTSLDGSAALAEDGRPLVDENYRPYDKLKMPRFFLSDHQVKALVTYVTSIRRPLVKENLRQVADEATQRVIRGRQIATRFNCYGCHNIDGNDVHIHDAFGVYDEEGFYDADTLNWAPPRLVGQGAKTQSNWLYSFLQNVHPIRPWLRIRMPSFALTPNDATGLVDYFAGHARVLHDALRDDVEQIDAYLASLSQHVQALEARRAETETSLAALGDPESPAAKKAAKNLVQERDDLAVQISRSRDEATYWFETDNPSLAIAVERLAHFAVEADLVVQAQLTGRDVISEDAADAWDLVLGQVRTLADVYTTQYPYTGNFDPDATANSPEAADQKYERGRQLFTIMGCMTGLCHRVGEQDLLAANNFLVATSMDEAEGDEDEEGYEEEGYDDEGYDDYGEAEEGEGRIQMRPDGPPGGAPNLHLVADRLQADWVKQWLVHSNIIQPGTRMQQYFRDMEGRFPASYFASLPEEERKAKESMYGYTAQQQRDLLMAFLYTVGPRRVTLKPDGEPLAGGPAEPVALDALAPPPVEETPTKDVAPDTTADTTAVMPSPDAPKPEAATAPDVAAPVAVPITGWHDDATTAYEGDAVQGHRTQVIGTISFKGKRKRMKRLRMDADMVCADHHETPIRAQTEDISKEGMVRNALVYVRKDFKGKTFEIPDPARIDQYGCVYVPHVTAVMTGQQVLIANQDRTSHNVNILAKKNPKTNFMQSTKGAVTPKTFKRDEMAIVMKCDVHPWMNGILHVLDHPYFAVTNDQGRFQIKGLPPGTYTLEVLHESKRIPPVTFDVTVESETSHRADAVLSYK